MRRERIEVDGQVVFPVFVHEFDDNSMMQFDKVEALHHLEAIDVQNGEYEAWDAQGRVLRLTASDITTLKSGRIK